MEILPVAGWYTDPFDVSGLRYWDGARWTTETRRSGGTALAPPLEIDLNAAVPPPGAPVVEFAAQQPAAVQPSHKGIGAGGIIGILFTVGLLIIGAIVAFGLLENAKDDNEPTPSITVTQSAEPAEDTAVDKPDVEQPAIETPAPEETADVPAPVASEPAPSASS